MLAEIEAQIKAKEAELIAVNTKRRDGVAQVGADARRLREDFDRRPGTKREETDRKREELLAGMAALVRKARRKRSRLNRSLRRPLKEDTLRASARWRRFARN